MQMVDGLCASSRGIWSCSQAPTEKWEVGSGGRGGSQRVAMVRVKVTLEERPGWKVELGHMVHGLRHRLTASLRIGPGAEVGNPSRH